MYILHFDGMLHTSGSQRMPISLLGYGWAIQRNGLEIVRGFGLFLRKCRTGSNIAEYLALIDGLEALADLRIGHETVQVRGDAKCVIDQMIGSSGVSSPLTRQLHQRARKLAKHFTSLTWVWVPRSENRYADSLSRRSFRYLQYSSRLDREMNRFQFPAAYGDRLVSLVDLRVHTSAPMTGKPVVVNDWNFKRMNEEDR
jgi:ribonuclease HI